MATTTNYSWTTPDDTDLVKDGAAAIRTLGSSVDTTVKNLNPETTTGAISYRGATANQKVALPIGTARQVLQVNSGATAPEWVASPQSVLTTTGDSLYASSANTLARLALGTAGQVLTVNSGATAPEWAALPVSGGMTLISTTTLTGASVTLSSIPSTYKNLQLIVRNYKPSTAARLNVRLNADSGSNRHRLDFNTSTEALTFNATSWGTSSDGNDATWTNIIKVDIFDYANAVTLKAGTIQSINAQSSGFDDRFIQAYYNQTTAISSLELFPGAGTFTSGTALLYGVA